MSTNRTTQRMVIDLPVSLEMFGGRAGAGFDNAPALLRCLEAYGLDGDGKLIAPACINFLPGKYEFHSQQDIALANSAGLSLRGAGQELTWLVFGNTHGFSITFSDIANSSTGNSLNVSDLAIVTSAAAIGKVAFLVYGNNPYGSICKRTNFTRVAVHGTETENDTYWSGGLQFTDIQSINIDNFKYIGHGGGGFRTGTAIWIAGSGVGATPTEFTLNDLHIYAAEVGVLTTGNMEGLTINNSVIIHVDYGVKGDQIGPCLFVTNSHINAVKAGIATGPNCSQGCISGNVIYVGMAVAFGNPGGISIAGNAFTVIGNVLVVAVPFGTNAPVGIAAAGSGYHTIVGNHVGGCDVGIWLQAGSSFNKGGFNTFGTNVTNVQDDGTSNVVS